MNKISNILGKVNKVILIVFLVIIGFTAGILFFNFILMPQYVRLDDITISPNVINLPVDSARVLAKKSKLHLFVTKYEYNYVIKEGRIVNQDPIPGMRVKVDRKLKVTISKGPEKIFVPDLSNMPLEQAKNVLKSLNLEIDAINYVYDEKVEKDFVISNIPAPNTPVPIKTLVTLIVSKGKKPEFVLVPNLIGKTLDEAEKILKEAGLVLGKISFEKNEEYIPETVIKQSIIPGKNVVYGDTINVIVSQ